ncbi:MAG: hypothetical protein IPM56_09535 [Ignavibacteriales bacterium]|nr:MAG: hypothetical protein IPM56_09535 [Ignavibacteriales bacterium]
MRKILVLLSIILLFAGVFGSALDKTPVEINPSPSNVDEWNLSYVNGQQRLSIKDIDSVTAFSNRKLALAIIHQ